ncbi:hypothetical protein ACET3X_001300 [Alternaria dauci]|uniref:J domain-containing protein n=1 Tax=Alternaria dauci TaxID=48095 RepID=A0ABR3UWX4_9PLEO
MRICKPTEPEIPDHYFDLGVDQYATAADLKKAFRVLALLHHPDKKAPGRTIDAVEFRRVHEAFDVLRNSTTRGEYDAQYEKVQEEWEEYRSNLAEYAKQEEQERLEAAYERARMLEEERRLAEEKKRQAEEVARAEAECAARKEKEKVAEERSRQAAERAQRERQKAAEERLRQWEEEEEVKAKQHREQRQREAEEREARVWERHRAEQERKAQAYLAAAKAREEMVAQKTRIKEETMVQDYLQQFFSGAANVEASRLQHRVRSANMWVRQLHADAKSASEFIPDVQVEAVKLGWHRIDGTAICDFCVKPVKLYFFSCLLGGAAACGDCSYKMAHGYKMAHSEVDGKHKGEEQDTEKRQTETRQAEKKQAEKKPVVKNAGKAGMKKGKGKGKGRANK